MIPAKPLALLGGPPKPSAKASSVPRAQWTCGPSKWIATTTASWAWAAGRSCQGRARPAVRAFEDELGVQPPLGFWDPMGFTDDGDLAAYRRRRSVEFKHGRIAMLATMGFMTPEIIGHWPGYLSPSMQLKFEDVPSGLAAVPVVPMLGWVQILIYFGLIEYSAGFDDYRSGTPGDYGWKILTSDDPQELQRRLNADLANGRLAMVSIMALLFQNGIAGTTGPEMWLPKL
mmetsp:Transcript_30811/g.57766  ORF Transcript_30811/g.57766 Transcript_30811/m.57766 type:complete len:230 (+) Transcript_30811:50-739(+)